MRLARHFVLSPLPVLHVSVEGCDERRGRRELSRLWRYVNVVLELADGEERVLGPVLVTPDGILLHGFGNSALREAIPGASITRFRCRACARTYPTRRGRDRHEKGCDGT